MPKKVSAGMKKTTPGSTGRHIFGRPGGGGVSLIQARFQPDFSSNLTRRAPQPGCGGSKWIPMEAPGDLGLDF